MGAFDEIDPPGRSSPSYNGNGSRMLGRGMGEVRRRVLLIVFLAGLFLVSFLAFRRHDQITDIIHESKNSWKAPASSSSSSSTPDSDTIAHAAKKLSRPSAEESSSTTSDAESKGKSPFSYGKTHAASKSTVSPGPTLGDRKLSDKNLDDVRNETLGFEQVYVLNVPSRTDKSDAMRLTASLTGFNFEVIPGIKGDDVPKKALSGEFDEVRGVMGVIGCWRGHMNFAAKMIEKRHATALIMEDDADWDVDFRQQLELVALGGQTLLDTAKDVVPNSPYGDGWDLIWLGHCASQPDDGDYRRFVMKNDRSVTPPTHRVNFGSIPDMSPYDNSTRIMYFTKGSTCTYAYALSFKGAQKVLKYLSMDIYNKPVDFGLHDMCTHKDRDFKCLGVFPQIIADHKPAGGALKDSDIGTSDSAGDVRQTGFSYNIVRSTRLNVRKLIDGKRNEAVSQWPEDTPELEGPVELEIRQEPVPDTID